MHHSYQRLAIFFSLLLVIISLSAPLHAFASAHHISLNQHVIAASSHLVPSVPATDIQPAWWNSTTGPNIPCDYTNYKNYTGVKPIRLTSWRGIEVCGPAPTTDHPVQFIPNPNGTTELEFECPELVKRYLLLLYDIPSVSAYGYQIVDAYTQAYPNLLKKITPNMHIFPSVGDVLSYGTTRPGHTSIVTVVANKNATGAGSADVTVIEQNISGLANGTEKMHMSNWQMTGIAGTVASWMTSRKWNVAQSPSPTGENIALTSVAMVSQNEAWAVGSYFNRSLNEPQAFIEHLKRGKWILDSSPVPAWSGLASVTAISPTDVWAVGSYGGYNSGRTLIMNWNGQQWQVIPSPNFNGDDYLESVWAVNATDVWAVGFASFSPSPGAQTLTEHWDGISWSIISSPNQFLDTGYNYLYSVTTIASNDVWAVGLASSGSSGGQQTLTMHWDGSQWTIVSSPSEGGTTANNFLYGVAAAASKDVWAVGYYTHNSGSGDQLPIIMHWDGNSWTVIPNPNQGPYDNFLYALAVRSSNDVWAVGNYSTGATSGVYYNTLVLHWDGRQWNIIPSSGRASIQTSILYGIALTSSNNAWAVGEDYNNSGFSEPLIEHFS